MKKFNLTIYFLLLLLFPVCSYGQIEGEVLKPQNGKFLLKGGTVVTVTNGIMENTSVLLEDGKIKAIGTGIDAGDATVIDCTDHYVYPGMIDSGTRLGLVEVGSLAETQDYAEIGNVTPNMQALTAINPNSVAIPVTRVSGVTTALSVPSGGLFPGTAALINLNGYTPDQMYTGFKGIPMNFPTSARRGRWDRRSDEEIEKDAREALKNINEIWERATTYMKLEDADASLTYYPEMEQLAKAVRGDLPLLIEVNKAEDILKALEWIKEKEVKKAVLTGVSEGFRVAEKIADAGIAVITGPVLALPSRSSDRYDAAYSNPGKMHKAGVKVAIRTSDTENVRNLPFNAGFAAAYGMGKEEALKAITIVPAEIFGVDDHLGSIEEGKSATVFVADGDPFETKTQIKHVFIDGYKIPMTSRHIRLYQEFLERNPGLEK
ncbi:amidohydrolase family protein [Echinicola vietnamensis]|uniref:Amidohydrolase, imidazolonepropionase n=1 Tax=Echinicola vietnamensis (strain DSM 17526 / LMG 23754 / KMM 6221) TaxID=926556 RepID=L0G4S0_ECHVK|nr:amidohydrolase family protein [Echinicola vietnamensis]AGA79830.1 amidohydrolase, imidazolonepropionase [Echinicola vietnamensis DSM 17526]